MSHIYLSATVLLWSIVLINGYYVKFQVWEDGPCRNHEYTEVADNECWYFDYGKSSARIITGSCAVIRKTKCNGGESYMVAYPERDLCELPCCGWNDNLYSFEDCDSHQVSIRCPTGSYVRQIDHNPTTVEGMKSGMTVHCYNPTEDTPTMSRNTHGKTVANPTRATCPIAAHGLNLRHDTTWDIYYSPTMDCSRRRNSLSVAHKGMVQPNETLHSFDRTSSKIMGRIPERYKVDNTTGLTTTPVEILELCPSGQAFTGIDVIIDEAEVIKRITQSCTTVPDPATMCEPQENLKVVVECDNTRSGNVMTCTYSETKGVGLSQSMTETERKEHTFSREYGMTIGGSIYGLSLEMSAKLGFSDLVGYEWSREDTSTWTTETTVSASIEVRPYVHSKVEQLTGKCTFYATSVNFFQQTDVNTKTGETSVRYFSA